MSVGKIKIETTKEPGGWKARVWEFQPDIAKFVRIAWANSKSRHKAIEFAVGRAIEATRGET